jgi:hypothetical protein
MYARYSAVAGLKKTGVNRKAARIRHFRNNKKLDVYWTSGSVNNKARTKRAIHMQQGDMLEFNNNLSKTKYDVKLNSLGALKEVGLVHIGGKRNEIVEGELYHKGKPCDSVKVIIRKNGKEYPATTDILGRFAVRLESVADSYELVVPYLCKNKDDPRALQDTTAVTVSGNDDRKVRIVVFLDDNGKVIDKFIP